VTGHSVGLVSTGKGKFPEKTSSKTCKWGDVDKGCLDNGCSESKGVQSFTYGCLCRRRVAPVLDAIFPSPIHAFYSLLLIFLQEVNQGTLPWHGDQWWKYYPKVLSQK
jgi:hypothetical protein